MSNQKLELKLKGLFTNPSNLSEVPPGALEQADNIVIDRESIAQTRRGQKTYGDQLSGLISSLFKYRGTLISSYDNKLAYDSNGAGEWLPYTGDYAQPDTGFKIRSVEANRNFYFTTSQGIFKLDSISSTPKTSGAFKGLDGSGLLNASVGGFLANNNQVAYRIIWGYKDSNGNLIIGAPSQRVTVINDSGNSKNVDLKFTIPSGVTTDWLYQIYRSGESGGLTIEPNDDLQLVIEGNPSASQVAALELIVTDLTPNDLRGTTIYTSSSQEGIANANETPPFAKDMTVFKDHVFYANTKSKGRLYVTLVSVGSPGFGYFTDATCETVLGSPVITAISDTTKVRVGMRVVGTGIQLNSRIISIDSATQVTLDKNATATATVSVEFQDRLSVSGVDYFAGSSQDIAQSQFQAATAGTPGENIRDTALNIVNVVNKSPSNTSIYAIYMSGYSDLPGKILFEDRVIGASTFTVTSTNGSNFNPVLPTEKFITGNSISSPTVVTSPAHGLSTGSYVRFYNSNSVPSLDGDYQVTVTGTDTFTVPLNVTSAGNEGYWVTSERVVESDNDVKQNRVFFSKPKQPEAVPLYAYVDVGSADAPIKRIIALRDSVFLFKPDGIFRITGEDISSFRVSLLDNTATIKGPETAIAFDNQIYTYSDQGVIAVSDNGVAIISRPIEATLQQISSSLYDNFETASFAVSYESSRQYMLFTVTSQDDTYATQAFIFNSVTQSWTRWIMDRSCGIVNNRDDKLYMGNPTNDFVYQERKDFAASDYTDEEYPINIVSVTAFTLQLTSVAVISIGMTIRQGTKESIVESVDNANSTITVSKNLFWETGAAEVYQPIATKLKWVPFDMENAGILKHFREITLLFSDAAFNRAEVEFSTNLAQDPEAVEIIPQAIGAWGTFPWGTIRWGGGVGGQQPIRTYVPLEKTRAHWLNVAVFSNQAFTSFSLQGISIMFTPVSERFG
jgi:hypothetical protein